MKNGLIVVLVVIVLCLGGYIVYDKFLIEKQPENIDNSYQVFVENFKNELSKYDSNNQSYQYIKNDIVKDGYEIYLEENGSLFVKYFNEELNEKYSNYKISDNVLSFYAINVGQGGGNMLYFINEDGTVGSADTEYGIGTSNEIVIKKDIGYKNIVSIINSTFSDGFYGVHGPIFIDINGNIFSENLK